MQEEANKISELLKRGVSEVIDSYHLEQALKSGKTLKVKLGIDPTSPNIHLGNVTVLLKLRDFQELGHKIILIIGDFTAEIGDASDKNAERPMLSSAEVKSNMKSYLHQAGRIINIHKTKVYYNSKWLRKLKHKDIIEFMDIYSLSDFTSRKNIRERLDNGKRISLRELLYPINQGYDSVQVEADVEIGGTDQKFNMLAGRAMQSHFKIPAQDVLTVNLIMGSDGEKMSKSKDNTININDSPENVFGKVMNMPDTLIIPYFIHATRVPEDEIELYGRKMTETDSNPMEIKKRLAYEITKLFHGKSGADKAGDHFETVFQKKDMPADMPEKNIKSSNIIEALTESGLALSKGEARRILDEGGIKIDGKTVKSKDEKVKNGSILQKGKRSFVKIIFQ